MMQTHVHVKQGLALPYFEAANPAPELTPVTRTAIYGSDYPGIKPVLQITEGAQVSPGTLLFTALADERIRVSSPCAGRVLSIKRGHQRRLDRIVIQIDPQTDAASATDDPQVSSNIASAPAVTEQLLACGLWTSLRARPFNCIPSPDAPPHWLFVNAMRTNPQAPDPRPVIEANADHFFLGLRALSKLPANTTFLCQAHNTRLPAPQDIPNLRCVTFAGPHPAGLSGTHMHHLARVSIGCEAWSIGYQEVIAFGHYLATGRLDSHRVISLSGDGVTQPRLVRTIVGANCRELFPAELDLDSIIRFIPGSHLYPGQDSDDQDFLRRLDLQVRVTSDTPRASTRRNPLRYSPLLWRRFNPTKKHSKPRARSADDAMIPLEVFERIWPFTTPPVPLLRALLSGDTESAERLGCLELAPEDLELCSLVCPAQKNYAEALAQTLNTIREQL